MFCSRTLVGWQIGGDMRDLRVRLRLDLGPRNLLPLRFLLELGVLALPGAVTSHVGDAQGGQGGTCGWLDCPAAFDSIRSSCVPPADCGSKRWAAKEMTSSYASIPRA